MKRHAFTCTTAFVLIVLATGGAALGATNATPLAASKSMPFGVSASGTTTSESTSTVSDWAMSSRVSDGPTVDGFAPLAAAPAAAESLSVALDVTQMEQYWFWASGVEVTASGMKPGEEVTISAVLTSGEEFTWSSSVADDTGTLVRRVRYLDVDPDNTHPAAGLAQIRVASASGAVGTALLDITRNSNEKLGVTSDPSSISQDAFLDSPVTITVTGFEPWDKVFFNLGLPDTRMGAVGDTEGLHADENGVFTYELQAASVNSQVGEWLLSFQSGDGRQGLGLLQVTPGTPREVDKTVTPGADTISLVDFQTAPGMELGLGGFLPFDSYELFLTTPRGSEVSLGLARTNGEGSGVNSITGPSGAPVGTYTIRAVSTTTGSYGTATFTVDDGDGAHDPRVALEPATLSAAALHDPAQGTTLVGSDLEPGASLRINVRDSTWRRLALTEGADVYATVDDGGEIRVLLTTLEAPPAGQYTVWITTGFDALAYDFRLPLTVTASTEPDAVAPEADVPGSSPSDARPTDSPITTTPPTPTPTPTPTPAPVEVFPEDGGPVMPSEQDGFELPQPVSPVN